jgi:hypothetical protein
VLNTCPPDCPRRAGFVTVGGSVTHGQEQQKFKRLAEWKPVWECLTAVFGLIVAVTAAILAWHANSTQTSLTIKQNEPVITVKFTRHAYQNATLIKITGGEHDVDGTPQVTLYEVCAGVELARGSRSRKVFVFPVTPSYTQIPTYTNEPKGLLFTVEVRDEVTCSRGFHYRTTSAVVPIGVKVYVQITYKGTISPNVTAVYEFPGRKASTAGDVLDVAGLKACRTKGSALAQAIASSPIDSSAVAPALRAAGPCLVSGYLP